MAYTTNLKIDITNALTMMFDECMQRQQQRSLGWSSWWQQFQRIWVIWDLAQYLNLFTVILCDTWSICSLQNHNSEYNPHTSLPYLLCSNPKPKHDSIIKVVNHTETDQSSYSRSCCWTCTSEHVIHVAFLSSCNLSQHPGLCQ